jgi:hypothetical protein
MLKIRVTGTGQVIPETAVLCSILECGIYIYIYEDLTVNILSL